MKFTELKDELKSRLIVDAIKASIDGQKVQEVFDECVKHIPQNAFEGGNEEEVCVSYFKKHLEDLMKSSGQQPQQQVPSMNMEAKLPSIPGGGMSKASTPQVDAKQIKQTADLLRNTMEKRQNFSKNVSILKLLIDRPDPSQLILKGTTFVPATTLEKMEEYEKLLITTDQESVDNFKALKDAITGKKAVEANVPKFSPKIIGAVIRRPKANEDGTEDVTLTIDGLKSFLLQEMLFAMIPSSGEVNLGAKIRQATSQSTTVTGSQTVTYSVAFVNKKEAVESSNCSAITSHTVTDAKGNPVMVPATLRSKLAFKIKNVRSTKEDATRTVRLSGKGEVVKLERNREFFEIFGEAMKDSSVLLLPVTEKEREEALSKQAAAIASIPGFDFSTFFGVDAQQEQNTDSTVEV